MRALEVGALVVASAAAVVVAKSIFSSEQPMIQLPSSSSEVGSGLNEGILALLAKSPTQQTQDPTLGYAMMQMNSNMTSLINTSRNMSNESATVPLLYQMNSLLSTLVNRDEKSVTNVTSTGDGVKSALLGLLSYGDEYRDVVADALGTIDSEDNDVIEQVLNELNGSEPKVDKTWYNMVQSEYNPEGLIGKSISGIKQGFNWNVVPDELTKKNEVGYYAWKEGNLDILTEYAHDSNVSMGVIDQSYWDKIYPKEEKKGLLDLFLGKSNTNLISPNTGASKVASSSGGKSGVVNTKPTVGDTLKNVKGEPTLKPVVKGESVQETVARRNKEDKKSQRYVGSDGKIHNTAVADNRKKKP